MPRDSAHPRKSLRAATPADAAALAPLFAQLGYPSDEATIRERIEAAGNSALLMVAAESEALFGFVAVALKNDLITGARAEILGLLVDENHRSRGLGAELLAAAEAWAFDRGVPAVTVRSNVIRDRAHAFYLREGYQHVKAQHIFEKRAPS